jgi:hypothetical protein
MAKKIKVKEERTPFRSAVAGLGNAVGIANDWAADGYELKYCFAVVASNAEGKPMQCIYLLGQRKDA